MTGSAWIDVTEAWSVIEAAIAPLATEEVACEAAAGRVLRTAVRVDRDVPPFDRAAMDGFAVLSRDVRDASRSTPATLPVIGESTPGAAFLGSIPPASAVRIMTGAPLPAGLDCVVPVEETSGFGGPTVEIRASASAGTNVTPRGGERRAGEELLRPGWRLDAAAVGSLAIVGASRVVVGRRPRVAVLSTGNELVAHESLPAPTQIRNSNGPMLVCLASPFAAEVAALGIAGDTRAELRAAVQRGLQADLLFVTGGVSMGAYDFVTAALTECGVQVHFDRVALQPGKPTVFGTHPAGAVLALPGNPVSALTTFRLFGVPALRRLEGEIATRPRWSQAGADFSWTRRHAKWLFLPGRHDGDGTRVRTVAYAGSGDLLAYTRADCQIVLPPDRTHVRPGETVHVWPL